MISPHIQDLLNEQMRMEFYSAYFYLKMQSWFEEKSLSGFANWYDVQVKEERDHALRIRSFILRAGGSPRFFEISAPDENFADVGDILRRTLEHERLVTTRINALMTAAQEAHDYLTIQFLQWYIGEQCEEEETVSNLISRFEIAGESEAGILFMDSEMQSRTYVQATDTSQG